MESRRRTYGGSLLDADAKAFLTAADITDATITSAINTLVIDLKSYNIWSKMKALYPFVGGTASTHKWNLKDPRDLDVAFRLTFNGNFIHNSNGVIPNGDSFNGYADTSMNAFISMSLTNAHFSFYSNTNNIDSAGAQFGYSGTYVAASVLFLDITNKYYIFGRDNGAQYVNFTSSTKSGFFIANSSAINSRKVYKNGSIVGSSTVDNTGTVGNANILLFRVYNAYSTHNRCALASIGESFTDTDAYNYYAAVQKFQTTLGRNV